MERSALWVLLCALVSVVAAQRRGVLDSLRPAGCGVCALENCAPAVDCEAGVVKDSCNCCDMCGKKEFER